MTDTPKEGPTWRRWDDAWRDALYGPAGFYLRPEGPAGHFRTAAHAGPGVLAAALVRLARDAGCAGILDVGAGRGELLTALARHDEGTQHDGNPPLRLHGVDLVDRPVLLPPQVAWSRADRGVPYAAFDRALVVAWELLDTVPCPVLEVDEDGQPQRVLVDPRTGRERLGWPPDDEERRWCARWWPLDDAAPGTRAEVGLPRDAWWQGHVRLLSRVGAGLLLAVDYAHTGATRPPLGTLSGYRSGRLVQPVPDGSCDVTAHVALDAVEDAGRAAGASPGVLVRQDDALRALGTTSDRPGAEELLDADGLGGFCWLLQGVGRPTEDPRD